jgi:hypothetical protein
MTMPGPNFWADLLKIKAAFDATYGPVGGMTLPVEALRSRRNGEIVEHGWMILYQFGYVDGADYLDVYDAHRLTSDSHRRIMLLEPRRIFPHFAAAWSSLVVQLKQRCDGLSRKARSTTSQSAGYLTRSGAGSSKKPFRSHSRRSAQRWSGD